MVIDQIKQRMSVLYYINSYVKYATWQALVKHKSQMHVGYRHLEWIGCQFKRTYCSRSWDMQHQCLKLNTNIYRRFFQAHHFFVSFFFIFEHLMSLKILSPDIKHIILRLFYAAVCQISTASSSCNYPKTSEIKHNHTKH